MFKEPTSPRDGASQAYIVVPAYNEGPSIAEVLAQLLAAYPHVVVVDDGSTDDTPGLARASGAHVLRHLINRGQGAALQTGIEFALKRGAEYVVTFDADGQHQVEDITAMLQPLLQDECDVTLGSRFLGQADGMPASRTIMLKLAVLFTRLVSRMPLSDAHNGLRAFTRSAAQQLDITLDRMAHASEIIDTIRRSGLRFREVPVKIRYTEYSLRKGQSVRDAFRVLFHYLVGRATR